MEIFLKGCLIGACVAFPIGGVPLYCIYRAIRSGFHAGIFSVGGLIIMDLFYAGIALAMFSVISLHIEKYEQTLKAVGGLVVIGLACYLFLKKEPEEDISQQSGIAPNVTNLLSLTAVTIKMSLLNWMHVVSITALLYVIFGQTLSETIEGNKMVFWAGILFMESVVWLIQIYVIVRLIHRYKITNLVALRKVFVGLIALLGLAIISSAFI